MDFEGKIISRDISQLLWEREETVSTAESSRVDVLQRR